MFGLVGVLQSRLSSRRSLGVIEVKSMKMKLQKPLLEQVSLQECGQKLHVVFFSVGL